MKNRNKQFKKGVKTSNNLINRINGFLKNSPFKKKRNIFYLLVIVEKLYCLFF